MAIGILFHYDIIGYINAERNSGNQVYVLAEQYFIINNIYDRGKAPYEYKNDVRIYQFFIIDGDGMYKIRKSPGNFRL